MICDGVKPVALAGVMGGLNSEIRDTTEAVMFESAKFARDNVRKTARALGKATDASARYEKGVDEYSTVLGMKRALHLMEEAVYELMEIFRVSEEAETAQKNSNEKFTGSPLSGSRSNFFSSSWTKCIRRIFLMCAVSRRKSRNPA